MAWTKINMWISIIAMVGIIAGLTIAFGNELSGRSDIILDNESIEYISNYGGVVNNTGILDLYADENAELIGESVTTDEDVGIPIISDAIAAITFLKTQWNKISSFIFVVYTIPAFLISSVGIPLSRSVSYIVSTLIYVIFVSIVIMVKKFLSH